jgi:hypothetical protein
MPNPFVAAKAGTARARPVRIMAPMVKFAKNFLFIMLIFIALFNDF